MSKFRGIHEMLDNGTNAILRHNYRPVQAVQKRIVLRSFPTLNLPAQQFADNSPASSAVTLSSLDRVRMSFILVVAAVVHSVGLTTPVVV